MVNQRPSQFSGSSRFAPASSGYARPPGSGSKTISASPSASRATKLGLGLGKGAAGLGKGKGKGLKRHAKIMRDNIHGVTKGDIRRMARRGGVKRISATIYNDVRDALKARLTDIMKDVVAIVEHSGRKTVTVTDIIFTLNRGSLHCQVVVRQLTSFSSTAARSTASTQASSVIAKYVV